MPALTAPTLTIRGLHKSFTLHAIDGRRVISLRGIDLEVGAGEHVALAGPSGAGKSSLLRCVHRTYLPDAGTITLATCTDGDGAVRLTELTELPDRAMARLRGRDLGYVAQFLAAPPRTGPMGVVAAAARRRGLDREQASDAAADALHALGLDETLWDVDCGVLSGGERQRVNLAAGTVRPPQLLLLDEPVSALDPANRELALGLIEALGAQGVAVLAVFHDAEVTRRLATRVVALADGRIAAQGTPAEVLGAVA